MGKEMRDSLIALFQEYGGPFPEWLHNATPKQLENWRSVGKPIVNDLDDEKAMWWYLRTYRPKKRGGGMMKRDHVKIGEPEHYYIKHMEGLTNPMGSIQGEIMATFGISDDVQEEIDDAVTKHLRVTLSDREKKRISQEGRKLASILGL